MYGNTPVEDLEFLFSRFEYSEIPRKTVNNFVETVKELREQYQKLPGTSGQTNRQQGRNSRKRKMPSSSENDSRMKKVCYQLDKKIQKYERRIRKLDQIISDIENN